MYHPLNHCTTAANFPPSGQKHAAPHLRIFELMDPVEKSAVWSQDRQQLHVVVLLRLGCTPVFRITTGSSYEGMKKLPSYSKDDGTPYKVLGGQEYVECVVSALGEFKRTRDGTRLDPPKYILHDKAPQHTCNHTKVELPKYIQVLKLPTDSPDLTPCDTNFFSAVKGRWQMETLRDPMPWAGRCKLAQNIIKTTNPDKHIQALPLRWKACINVEGWHIEQEYKMLKAAKKAG
jgi:hypothetical protein